MLMTPTKTIKPTRKNTMIDLADIISPNDMATLAFNDKLFWFIQFVKQFPKETVNNPAYPHTYELIHDILGILYRLHHRPSANVETMIDGLQIPEVFYFKKPEASLIVALKNAIFLMFLTLLVQNLMQRLSRANPKAVGGITVKRSRLASLRKQRDFFLTESLDWLYASNEIEHEDEAQAEESTQAKDSIFILKLNIHTAIVKLQELKAFCVENRVS